MIKTKLLTKNYLSNYNFNYKKLQSVLDYQSEKCILIGTSHPDYGMILDDVELIITKSGSILSHLSIVANEKNVTILRINPKDFDSLSNLGKLLIEPASLAIHLN